MIIGFLFIFLINQGENMKKLSNQIKLTAIAAVMGASFSLPAQADVLATAILDISNLRFINTATGAVLQQGNEITIATGGNSGRISADLDSVPGSLITNQSVGANSILNGVGGQFDSSPVFERDILTPMPSRITLGNNNFGVATVPVTVSSSYAYADHVLQGAAIGGLGVSEGAHAGTIAEVGLITNDSGIAGASTGTNSSFVSNIDFGVGSTDLQVDLIFNYVAQALAFVSDDAVTFSNAQATINFTLTITDLVNSALTRSFTPDELNRTLNSSDFIPGTDEYYDVGTNFVAASYTLLAGRNYRLTIAQTTEATAANTNSTEIPEPGTLALLGLGLLGLVASPVVRRRG